MFKQVFLTLALIVLVNASKSKSKHHHRDLRPIELPDTLWADSVSDFTVNLELSEDAFNSDTVIQADCFVSFDRFTIEDNSYAIVFKAGDKPIASYETRNEFLNVTDFRANVENLRQTKHQILNLPLDLTPEGAVSILLKPAFADVFSCEVEVMQNKRIPIRIPYVHDSNSVQTSTKPETVAVTLTVPEADLINCAVVFQESPEEFNVCYYDYTLGQNRGCFGTGTGLVIKRDAVTFNAQFNVNGLPGPGACVATFGGKNYRSKERFIRP